MASGMTHRRKVPPDQVHQCAPCWAPDTRKLGIAMRALRKIGPDRSLHLTPGMRLLLPDLGTLSCVPAPVVVMRLLHDGLGAGIFHRVESWRDHTEAGRGRLGAG